MVGFAHRLTVVLVLTLAITLPRVAAAESSAQDRVVERARIALDSFLDDSNFEEMRAYVQNAYAVLVFPEMVKGGFFFGAEHGIGVLLVRDPQSGAWGQPAFCELYGGSFGLQFGIQSADVVFTVMNELAVQRIVSSDLKLKLGADAGLAAGSIGATVGAATTTAFGDDVYMFAKGKGLYGGMTVDGSVIAPKDEWNRLYYGRDVAVEELLRARQRIATADVAALHQSLTRF